MDVLSREDREDRLQEIMERIYRSLDQYNPLYSPATWIYTIARRIIIDGDRRRDRSPEIVDGDTLDILPGSYPSPEDQVMDRDLAQRVRDFILCQNGRDRQLLFLVCYEEMSGRAAAGVMGMPVGTVRDRLRKLKEKLQEELDETEQT
ncbi:MAG: sigma-70 family RNA polymerase sigma factor [Spirochaetales bacterium]|nr:sigma-70 family RNA polymerase sigma factor [Spirochaetales bacterium]